MYIAVLDDDRSYAIKLQKYIKDYLDRLGISAKISLYTKSDGLIGDIKDGVYFDLILSDIDMPEINGMQLASIVKELSPDVVLIFITAYMEYVVDSYELDVFRYIPKSELDIRLPSALKSAAQLISQRAENFYTFYLHKEVSKVPCREILYIQKEERHTRFVLGNGREIRIRKSLASVFEGLNDHDFTYIDRNVIVNLSNVSNMKDCVIRLKNGTQLEVSRRRSKEIADRIFEYWGGIM